MGSERIEGKIRLYIGGTLSRSCALVDALKDIDVDVDAQIVDEMRAGLDKGVYTAICTNDPVERRHIVEMNVEPVMPIDDFCNLFNTGERFEQPKHHRHQNRPDHPGTRITSAKQSRKGKWK